MNRPTRNFTHQRYSLFTGIFRLSDFFEKQLHAVTMPRFGFAVHVHVLDFWLRGYSFSKYAPKEGGGGVGGQALCVCQCIVVIVTS